MTRAHQISHEEAPNHSQSGKRIVFTDSHGTRTQTDEIMYEH